MEISKRAKFKGIPLSNVGGVPSTNFSDGQDGQDETQLLHFIREFFKL
jgi:hypothetical protein